LHDFFVITLLYNTGDVATNFALKSGMLLHQVVMLQCMSCIF
jgi:hypothetical protein